MDERVERSIEELESANRLLEFLGTLTEEQWLSASSKGGWPVPALAYHIADGYRLHLLWLEHLRFRHDVPGSPQDLDEGNARTAHDAYAFGPETTRRALDSGGRVLVAYLRGLGSEELDRSARHGPLGGHEVSVADMLEIAPRHVREHLASLQVAVARPGPSRT